jgi:hypothetical protein
MLYGGPDLESLRYGHFIPRPSPPRPPPGVGRRHRAGRGDVVGGEPCGRSHGRSTSGGFTFVLGSLDRGLARAAVRPSPRSAWSCAPTAWCASPSRRPTGSAKSALGAWDGGRRHGPPLPPVPPRHQRPSTSLPHHPLREGPRRREPMALKPHPAFAPGRRGCARSRSAPVVSKMPALRLARIGHALAVGFLLVPTRSGG